MEIGRGPYAVLGLPRRRGATLAEPREDETLRAHGFSVEEQLHAVAIRVAGHGEVLALASLPVPVRKQAKHGLVGPLTLVEVEAVLREAAAIDAAGRATSTGPAGFADVIDSGPHEIARYVVVGTHEFPELLGVQPTEAAPSAKAARPSARRAAAPRLRQRAASRRRRDDGRLPGSRRKHGPVVAPRAAHSGALRADHAPIRMGRLVDAVVQFFAFPPTVHVVIAHHVQQAQKLH